MATNNQQVLIPIGIHRKNNNSEESIIGLKVYDPITQTCRLYNFPQIRQLLDNNIYVVGALIRTSKQNKSIRIIHNVGFNVNDLALVDEFGSEIQPGKPVIIGYTNKDNYTKYIVVNSKGEEQLISMKDIIKMDVVGRNLGNNIHKSLNRKYQR